MYYYPSEKTYVKFNHLSNDFSNIVGKIDYLYEPKDDNRTRAIKKIMPIGKFLKLDDNKSKFNNYLEYIKDVNRYNRLVIRIPKESILHLNNRCLKYFKKEFKYKGFHRGLGHLSHLKGKVKSRSRPIILNKEGYYEEAQYFYKAPSNLNILQFISEEEYNQYLTKLNMIRFLPNILYIYQIPSELGKIMFSFLSL